MRELYNNYRYLQNVHFQTCRANIFNIGTEPTLETDSTEEIMQSHVFTRRGGYLFEVLFYGIIQLKEYIGTAILQIDVDLTYAYPTLNHKAVF